MLRRSGLYHALSLFILFIISHSHAFANMNQCSLNCAGIRPTELATLCLANCVDTQINNKIKSSNENLDSRWQTVLADTDARLDTTINEANQILAMPEIELTQGQPAPNDMLLAQLNKVEQIEDSQIQKITGMLSSDNAFLLGSALASGMTLGAKITDGLIGAIETGLTELVALVHELITHEKKKTAIKQNFVKAAERFDQLLLARDESLTTIEESLVFFDLYNGISSINGLTPGSDKQSFRLQRSRLRERMAILDKIKSENLGSGNDCWVQADIEQSEISELITTLDEVISMLPESETQIDPRAQICSNMLEQISSQIDLENQIQEARAKIIQGHFVVREARLHDLASTAGLFGNEDDFSDDALAAAVRALGASGASRTDIRYAVSALMASQNEIVQLIEKNRSDVNININDVVIGFMFDDFKVTKLIREQICFNSPMRCSRLKVDDKRKRALWALDDLSHRCQSINNPEQTCEVNSNGFRTNCDISDQINLVLERVEQSMSFELMNEYTRIPAGTKLDEDSIIFRNLIRSGEDI